MLPKGREARAQQCIASERFVTHQLISQLVQAPCPFKDVTAVTVLYIATGTRSSNFTGATNIIIIIELISCENEVGLFTLHTTLA